MISSDEELLPTNHKDIFLVKSKNKQDSIKAIDFSNLLKVTPYMEDSKIKSILKSYL
jgi:hypothetical protein